MKKILISLCLSVSCLHAVAPNAQLFQEEQNLVINNRVLLKVNGKPISVMDVARKMDLIFYRQFPELASSPVARYQFFSSAWESMLRAVIDDYLILADAKEKGITISEGEIREELETIFGPDVVLNLDKLGLTLSEAIEQLKMDLIVQRMNMVMVRSKAITEVHPKKVRERYEQMLEANPPKDRWVYRVLSVRGEDHEKVAEQAYALLNEQKLPFEDVLADLKGPNIQLSLSDSYAREDGEISLAHKAILQTLSAGAMSSPLISGEVSRLFLLQEHQDPTPVPYNEMANTLQGELTSEVAADLGEAYRLKLRKHYGLTDQYLKQVIPEKFQPFTLQ